MLSNDNEIATENEKEIIGELDNVTNKKINELDGEIVYSYSLFLTSLPITKTG